MEDEKRPATAAELFSAAPKRRYKDLVLPVMGLPVRIRSLTERELSGYTNALLTNDGQGRLRKSRMEDATRRLLCLCLVDAEGDRLLADADAGKLVESDSADTQFLYTECAEWVGLKRGDVEDLVKNSEKVRVAA